MGWVFAALLVVVIALTVLAAAGRLGQMGPYIDDRPVPELPADGVLTGAELSDLKFAVVTRGYSMAQVDAVLARLAEQLDQSHEWAVTDDRRGRTANGWPALTVPLPDDSPSDAE